MYFSTENKSTIDLDEFLKFKKHLNFTLNVLCNCIVNGDWAISFLMIAVNKSLL